MVRRHVGHRLELTTVADDEAVLHDGTTVVRLQALEPDTDYTEHGHSFRTLARPGGERLATVATVNDLHIGETECGRYDGVDLGPVLRSEPGEDPYPETMSKAVVAEIAALSPDAVVAKGDLTARGAVADVATFLDHFVTAFDDRLHCLNGNHDVAGTGSAGLDAPPVAEVTLPGVRLALLDTSLPGRASGALNADQLAWLDELGSRADRPVLVFGHHHPWNPGSPSRPASYFGIEPGASERLVDVFARRPTLAGYFAGHTHRNRVRRFARTGDVPWVEVSAVKDYPGGWAEYRVYEGGVLQVFRRASAPEALAWTERTRALFGGLYPGYSFGSLADRCFAITFAR
ncbi:MAG: metallophosphoesterase family protein [Acidimicrobiales bacterium]